MLEKNNVIKIIPLTTNSKVFKHRSIGLILNERMGKNWLIYSQLKIHKLPIDRCYIADTAKDFSDVIICHYTHKKRKAIEHYIPKKVVDRAKAQGHLYIIHTIESTPEHLFEVDKKNYSGQDLTKKVYDLLQIKF